MPRKNLDRIRTNVYLGREQREKLMRLSIQTGRPWAEYIRDGIDLVLKKYQRKVKQPKK